MGTRRVIVLGILMLCAVAARPAGAESSIVLPRPGQVGLEIGGGYGLLAKSGDLGNLYDTGPTFVLKGRIVTMDGGQPAGGE